LKGVRQAKLVYKWANGDAVPSKRTVARIAQQIPDSDILYSLPLWELLEDRPIAQSIIEKRIAPYWVPMPPSDIGFWKFPKNNFARSSYPYTVFGRDNNIDLFERGDIYGFTALVAITREGEAVRDADQHWFLCAEVYRAIPAIVKEPWLKEHLPLLRECLLSVQLRLMTTLMLFTVDWAIIEKQILDLNYETIRHRRPRDPKTHRFIDLEDPIIMKLR